MKRIDEEKLEKVINRETNLFRFLSVNETIAVAEIIKYCLEDEPEEVVAKMKSQKELAGIIIEKDLRVRELEEAVTKNEQFNNVGKPCPLCKKGIIAYEKIGEYEKVECNNIKCPPYALRHCGFVSEDDVIGPVMCVKTKPCDEHTEKVESKTLKDLAIDVEIESFICMRCGQGCACTTEKNELKLDLETVAKRETGVLRPYLARIKELTGALENLSTMSFWGGRTDEEAASAGYEQLKLINNIALEALNKL